MIMVKCSVHRLKTKHSKFCWSLKLCEWDTLIHLWWVRIQDLQLWCSKISSDSCITFGQIILSNLNTTHYLSSTTNITLHRHLNWRDWKELWTMKLEYADWQTWTVRTPYCEMLNCCFLLDFLWHIYLYTLDIYSHIYSVIIYTCIHYMCIYTGMFR